MPALPARASVSVCACACGCGSRAAEPVNKWLESMLAKAQSSPVQSCPVAARKPRSWKSASFPGQSVSHPHKMRVGLGGGQSVMHACYYAPIIKHDGAPLSLSSCCPRPSVSRVELCLIYRSSEGPLPPSERPRKIPMGCRL
ncbi:hypothetical protein VFPFJ_09321 [Purpureocillium lilacinum]|uniref:Uncharacterized protein n=1 Tax=Purpureocillium lilacinum TaxID=33203 RepID=A0A179GTT8_PURLI|nr:hypothetical protein VFPFJ_09321 [Purpureocillium lilacinum]OAQ80868.1 hypothetical protein VFPFJ_09321 [Purpureocillium lilacinum]